MGAKHPTPQQQILIDRYVAHGKLEQAALEAGYTESSARNIYRTMKFPHVVAAYQKRLDEVMSAREVLHRLGKRARESGDEQIALRALELLGKHHKLFTDKVEASGDGGGPINIRIIREGV